MIEAKDDVMTTFLTEGALFLMDFKIPTVPLTADNVISRQYMLN